MPRRFPVSSDKRFKTTTHVIDWGTPERARHSRIVTERRERAERLLRDVDASLVLVNASTRFNDGNQLGLGAEIGISTTKLHAYGPMGLASLTALKWVGYGEGQTR